MVAEHRPELPRVGAGGRVVPGQENRAVRLDRLDALDDLELGSIRPPRDDDIADPQLRAVIDGTGNDQ